jgi:16S rRNA (guanine966-N2)-methyltransferase
MPKRRQSRSSRSDPRSSQKRQIQVKPIGLRIIGGKYRGSKLQYGGDTRVRPMKDRLREAIFNLLGPPIKGKYALDLFGGTGAIGLEAISRGAIGATFVERHHPTAQIIKSNIAALKLESICELVESSSFFWFEQKPELPTDSPWVVFISPPYDFFIERTDEMLKLINDVYEAAPVGSLMAIESDKRFAFEDYPLLKDGLIRTYSPAVVDILEKTV